MNASLQVVDAEAFIDQKVEQSVADPENADQRDFRRAMALLGLMVSSEGISENVRERWARVAAFYDSDEDRITILDRGRPLDGPGAAFLLLHEVVHAMQHAEVDLNDERHYPTSDNSLAFSGKIEGEAVLYKDLAELEAYGRDPDDTDWDAVFQQFEDREWKAARADASPWNFASTRFSYAFGGDYVNRAWRAGGNAAVRQLYATLPSSTREILAGWGAAAPGGASWTENPDEIGMPVLPAEFEHVTLHHLGAWFFEVWKDLWNVDGKHSSRFTDSGFAGDVLTVFRFPATGDVAGFWRLRFGTPEPAAALVASLRSDPFVTVSTVGRDVIVASDTRGAPSASFVDALAWRAIASEDTAAANSAASSARLGAGVCGGEIFRP